MAETREILIEIEVDNNKAQQNLERTTSQLRVLQNERKELNKQVQQSSAQLKAEGTTRAAVNKRIVENELATKRLRGERNKAIKEVNLENNSLNALRNNLSKLTAERNNINTGTKEGAARFAELTEQIKNQNEEISKLEQAGGDFRRNVGNYGAALDGVKGVIGGVTAAFGALTIAVGVITTLFEAVRTALSRSEKGSLLLQKATNALSATFDVLVGLLTKVAEGLIFAFEEPQTALQNFGDSVQSFVLDRINAVVDGLGLLGDAIQKVFKGDFEGALDAAAEGSKKLFIESSVLYGLYDEATEVVGELVTELNTQTTALNAVTDAQNAYAISLAQSTVALAQLSKQEEEYNAIADDATLSFKERTAAADEARKASISRSEVELDLARQELDIVNKRIKANRDLGIETQNALRQEQAEALAKVIDAERELTSVQFENDKLNRELRQDTLEKNLDILIDGFDVQKSINERLIADEKLTLDERQKIANETQRLGQESFDAQIATIQQFTDQQVNANELISESNATVLQERIRGLELSEVIEGRLFEVIKERQIAEQDFAETQATLSDQRAEREQREREAALELREFELEQKQFDLEAEIQLERDKSALLLENERLTESERQLIREQSDKRIAELQRRFTDETTREQQRQIQQTAGVFGDLNTALNAIGVDFKAFAIAQAVTDTYAAANAALRSGSGLSPIAGIAAAAAAIGTGLANVARITSTKFANGGLVNGPSHANGGVKFAVGGQVNELEGGEAVINKRSTAMFKPLLSRLNVAGGGVKFADGGITKFQTGGVTGFGTANQISAQNESNAFIQDALLSAPAPVVSVTEINDVQDSVQVTEQTASL